MSTSFEIDGMRIDRVIEGEYPFQAAQRFLPALSDAALADATVVVVVVAVVVVARMKVQAPRVIAM